MSLFDDPAGEGAEGLADAAQVRALVFYGHREDVVRGWTYARAQAVLSRCKRDEKAAVRRAYSAARLQAEDDGARGQPSDTEREVAARFLEEALPGGIDDLLVAVSCTVYVLSDAELRVVAESLLATYRAGRPARV